GRVTSQTSLQGVTVEFYFGNHTTPDQTTTTDENGHFAIQPAGLDFGSGEQVTVKLSQADPVTHQVGTTAAATQSIDFQPITPDTTPSTAASTRNGAVNTAQSTYNQSLATANSAYLTSLAAASSS